MSVQIDEITRPVPPCDVNRLTVVATSEVSEQPIFILDSGYL